jgi:hypothetical protein
MSSNTLAPHRSRIASMTVSSPRSKAWTISSDEIVAAPCFSKALSASLLPAPMPPVIATLSRAVF